MWYVDTVGKGFDEVGLFLGAWGLADSVWSSGKKFTLSSAEMRT